MDDEQSSDVSEGYAYERWSAQTSVVSSLDMTRASTDDIK